MIRDYLWGFSGRGYKGARDEFDDVFGGRGRQ
jgi:hypothetical protein